MNAPMPKVAPALTLDELKAERATLRVSLAEIADTREKVGETSALVESTKDDLVTFADLARGDKEFAESTRW